MTGLTIVRNGKIRGILGTDQSLPDDVLDELLACLEDIALSDEMLQRSEEILYEGKGSTLAEVREKSEAIS